VEFLEGKKKEESGKLQKKLPQIALAKGEFQPYIKPTKNCI